MCACEHVHVCVCMCDNFWREVEVTYNIELSVLVSTRNRKIIIVNFMTNSGFPEVYYLKILEESIFISNIYQFGIKKYLKKLSHIFVSQIRKLRVRE